LISRPWPQSQTSSHQMNGGRTCATSVNADYFPHLHTSRTTSMTSFFR
jgi:hypothetical protein